MDKKKKLFFGVLIAMFLTLGIVTSYYMFMQAYYVQTDDAQVECTIVNLSPQITGRISDIYVSEGDPIKQGALIARQVDLSLSPQDNPDLAIIKSPINGRIIKKFGNVGEVGIPGTPIAMMTDLKDLYITANLEETDLQKVKNGQLVDFTIDAFPRTRFTGRVILVGDETLSALAPQNTSGSFTKVVQRIPVKISIDNYQGCQPLPGMNAVVRIHVR